MAEETQNREREFETGSDEFWKASSQNNYNNMKRTYDTYQDLDLNLSRQMNQLSVQALQNAVETANMVGKQAVRHADIAIDRQWNVDEQGYTAEKILAGMQEPSVVAAMSAAIAKVLSDMAVAK
jgi:hypothetical protein